MIRILIVLSYCLFVRLISIPLFVRLISTAGYVRGGIYFCNLRKFTYNWFGRIFFGHIKMKKMCPTSFFYLAFIISLWYYEFM